CPARSPRPPGLRPPGADRNADATQYRWAVRRPRPSAPRGSQTCHRFYGEASAPAEVRACKNRAVSAHDEGRHDSLPVDSDTEVDETPQGAAAPTRITFAA